MAQTATHEAGLGHAIADLKTALDALPSSKRLSHADAEAIYALAYNFVSQRHFESAFRYFSLLTFYQPTNVVYLAGLALTHKLMGRLDAAVGVYTFLAVLEPDDPAHTLAIAECQLLQHDYDEARANLDLVIRFCRENAGNDRVLSRAEALHGLIRNGAAPAGT